MTAAKPTRVRGGDLGAGRAGSQRLLQDGAWHRWLDCVGAAELFGSTSPDNGPHGDIESFGDLGVADTVTDQLAQFAGRDGQFGAEAKLRSVAVVMYSTIARPGLVILKGLQVNPDAMLRQLQSHVETWAERVRDSNVTRETTVARGDEAETLRCVAASHRASRIGVGDATHVSSHLGHHAAKLPSPTVIVRTA